MTEIESLTVVVTALVAFLPGAIIWIVSLTRESSRNQDDLHQLRRDLLDARFELRSERWDSERQLRDEIRKVERETWKAQRELDQAIWDLRLTQGR